MTLISLHLVETRQADEREPEIASLGERKSSRMKDECAFFRIVPRKLLIPDGLSVFDSGTVGQIPAIKGLSGKILRNKELAIENDGWGVRVPLSELEDSGRIFHDFPLVLDRE
ncbi:MAG: hypothetical protein WCF26_26140 [Candidatus Sulfotelmatobacter sp.]